MKFIKLILSIFLYIKYVSCSGADMEHNQMIMEDPHVGAEIQMEVEGDDAVDENDEKAREAIEFVENEVLNLNQNYTGEANEVNWFKNQLFYFIIVLVMEKARR